jgi:hypothetical protein
MGEVALNQQEDTHSFFYRKGNENRELGNGCFMYKSNISKVKKVEFVSNWISYIILRDC